jgi:hypothetical protein
MIFLGLCLGILGSIMLAVADEENIPIGIIGVVILWIGVFLLIHTSRDKGIKDGAYNQLRGKYEISYIIDKDSCITDTIINIK